MRFSEIICSYFFQGYGCSSGSAVLTLALNQRSLLPVIAWGVLSFGALSGLDIEEPTHLQSHMWKGIGPSESTNLGDWVITLALESLSLDC